MPLPPRLIYEPFATLDSRNDWTVHTKPPRTRHLTAEGKQHAREMRQRKACRECRKGKKKVLLQIFVLQIDPALISPVLFLS